MAGQIVLTGGTVESPDYRGPVEIRIDPIFLPGTSCIVVQTQPTALDLAEKRRFQDAVLRLLVQRGLLGAGSYKLQPSRRHALPGVHFFSGLRRRNVDILQTFCTSHGAVAMPQPAEAAARASRPRFTYLHRQVVTGDNERAARILAAGALPDNAMWSEIEVKQFKLESVEGRRHTFVVELTFGAANEERARRMVVELFGPLVKASAVVVTLAERPNQAAGRGLGKLGA